MFKFLSIFRNELKTIHLEFSGLVMIWNSNNEIMKTDSIRFKELKNDAKLFKVLFKRLLIDLDDLTEIDLNMFEKFKSLEVLEINK